MTWINDIFKNGTLKDNGVYTFVKDEGQYALKNRWNESIPVGVKIRGICSIKNWFAY